MWIFEFKILMVESFQATLFCDILYDPLGERSKEPKHQANLMNKQVVRPYLRFENMS